MDDPYSVLGVRRDDSDDTIRKAYRKLAKRYHPDLNPDKPEAQERFKAINTANQILSDPAMRARFDRGEIDGSGNEVQRERPRHRGPNTGPQGGAAGAGFGGESWDSIFADAMRHRHAGPAAGADAHFGLTIDFLDAARGAVKRIALPNGGDLDVSIPPGMQDGHLLRLRGKGHPGRAGGPPGDAIIDVTVASHSFFRREGNDILLDLPVTLQEAVLGASIEVPTINGKVRLKIPPNSANGAKMRLSGRGIAGGHQTVTLKLVLPAEPEPALTAFLEAWSPEHPQNLRKSLEAAK